MLTPRQIFDDNLRPADLLLKVYQLLEHDRANTEGELVASLRTLVGAKEDESLILVLNEVFLGLIRERANVTQASIRKNALCNLLRQALVTACTALETFLPALLRQHLHEVIKVKGRDFLNLKDKELLGHVSALKFDLPDVFRILADPDPLFVANKVATYLDLNLSGRRGVHVVGVILGIDDPWGKIGERLNRKPGDIAQFLEGTIARRNDIVHRADRNKLDLTGDQQAMTFSLASQAVDAVKHVCICLDELVMEEMTALRERAETQPEGVA